MSDSEKNKSEEGEEELQFDEEDDGMETKRRESDDEFQPEEEDDLDHFIVYDEEEVDEDEESTNGASKNQLIESETAKRHNTRSTVAKKKKKNNNSNGINRNNNNTTNNKRTILVISGSEEPAQTSRKKRRTIETQDVTGILRNETTHATRQRAEKLQTELSEQARKRIEELQREDQRALKNEIVSEDEESETDTDDEYVNVVVSRAQRYVATEGAKDILLPNGLASILKPHQLEGIQFCWRTVILPEAKSKGCILAHSMGLGKTLQMISFVYLYFKEKKGKNVLILAPKSTLLNWRYEFEEKWLRYYERGIKIPTFMIGDDMRTRKKQWQEIETWVKKGGVLLLGYEMFRNLVSEEKKIENEVEPEIVDVNNPYATILPTPPKKAITRLRRPKSNEWHIYKEKFQEALFRKTDLVICDEGHKIKNSETMLSKAVVQIKTRNRVVLTGTPLQNHLMEYFTMIDFVRPNYWTKDEFEDFFAKPIQKGFRVDAPPADVSIMKRRAHVLIKEVKPFIDRRDQRILKETLPEKHEYVILFKINKFQELLYRTFLEENENKRGPFVLLYMNAILSKIVNHPDLLLMYAQRNNITLESIYGSTEIGDIKMENNNENSDAYDSSNSCVELGNQYSRRNSPESRISIKNERNIVTDTPILIEDDDNEISISNRVSNQQRTQPFPIRPKVEQQWNQSSSRSSNALNIDDDDDDDILELDLVKAIDGALRKETSTGIPPRTEATSSSNTRTNNTSVKNEDTIQNGVTPVKKKNGESSNSNDSKSKRLIKKKKKKSSSSEDEEDDRNVEESVEEDLGDIYAEDERIMVKEIEKNKSILSWHWLLPVLKKGYVRDLITRSPKMEFLVRLIEKCYVIGEKILVFSMYTETLTLIENVLNTRCKFHIEGESAHRPLIKNIDYFRLDGSTPAAGRQRMINEFNSPESKQKVFLISIRAGSLGINLTSASRVVLFDVPWVPATAQQAIFRVYRYGQTKPCYIYRFVSAGTMEHKIFNRNILKTWLFKRVVDNDVPKRILEEADLDLFECNLDEFSEANLLNSAIYKDDPMLSAALGLGHVPATKHRLIPVDIVSPDNFNLSKISELAKDRNQLEQASTAIELQQLQEENKLGELDVKRKIVSVYHHESLYIDDLEDKVTDQEKQEGEAEYIERKNRYSARDSILSNMEFSVNTLPPGVAPTQVLNPQQQLQQLLNASSPLLPTASMMPTPAVTIPAPSPSFVSYPQIARNLPCNCVDCNELKVFLLDTNRLEHTMRISKQRRHHIHQILNPLYGISHSSVGSSRNRTLILRKTAQTSIPNLSTSTVSSSNSLDMIRELLWNQMTQQKN